MSSKSIRIFTMVFFDGYNGLRPVDRDRKRTAEIITLNEDTYSFYSISNPLKPIQYQDYYKKSVIKLHKSTLDRFNLLRKLFISGLLGKYDIIHSISDIFSISLYKTLKRKNKDSKHIYSLLCDPILTLIEEDSCKLEIKTNWESIPIFSKSEFRKYFKIEKFLISNADVVTGNSHRIIQKINEFYGIDCYYLPDGVDTKIFNPEGRFEQPYEKDNLKITYVGSYQTRKQPVLIKYLAESFPHHQFFCFGGGPYRETLQHFSKHLENLEVFPPISPFRIRDVYLKSDILFFPSVYEGLPKVMLEAGSTGLPILASNATGHPELVKDNFTGFLFSNVEEMIEKLAKFEDHQVRKRMGINIRKFIKKNYTIEITAKAYKKLLMTIS